MTSITSAGETTEKQTHMQAVKLSEGRYWGLDMAKKGDRIVLAGYTEILQRVARTTI